MDSVDILVFTHGTTVMHREAEHVSRAERVRQVQRQASSVRDLSTYVPVDGAREKLWRWHDHGASLAYLGPSRTPESIAKNDLLLRRLNFPPGSLHHRGPHESYAQVVERLSPAVYIEDDCESIGGAGEMATPHLSAAARARIACIVVPEFGGIDDLPDDPADLPTWAAAHPWHDPTASANQGC